MSAEATGWVFRCSPYRGAAFAVHLAIADSVSDQHGYRFWMKQTKLAAKARCSRSAVIAAIQQMTEEGLIELVEDRHALGLPNEYLFVMPGEIEVRFDATLSRGTTRGARSDDEACRVGRQALVASDDKRRTQVVTQPETQDDARAPLELVVVEETASATFDAFWTAYPRKIGKPEARKAWDAMRRAGTSGQTIVEGLAPWATYWRTRGDERFVPHPSTWLRREGWNDVPPSGGAQHAFGPGSTQIDEAWAGSTSGRIK